MPLSSPASADLLVSPERIDEPRFGLTLALAVALLLHLLLLLLVTAFPEFFLAPRLLWVEPETKPPPIKFTFMDLIDDHVVEDNPDADLISDKDREEAGESPRVTTPEGKEPPATGNTAERIDGGTVPEPLPDPGVSRQTIELPRPAPQPAALPADSPADSTQPSASSEPPPDDPAPPGPGAGGIEEGAADGRNQRRRDPQQRRIQQALQDLSLPMDLKALAPPEDDQPETPSSGRSTIWQFDNPNPSFPVKIGHLSFDSKGADFGPWLAEFHRRVLNEWHRNLEAWSLEVWRNISASRFIPDQEKQQRYAYQMGRIRGITGVDFVVTREGSVVSLQIIHRSGIDGLDRSVQRTLRNVILPVLPADYPDETLPIRAGFYYNVRPPN